MISSLLAVMLAVQVPTTVRIFDQSIMPPEPLALGGYTDRKGAKFIPGGEELMARVALINGVAFVTLEMLTIPESLVREVQNRIGGQFFVVLMATHTHCAPDSQMLNDRMTIPIPGIAMFNKRWLTWYADRIADTITRASNVKPIEGTTRVSFTDIPLGRGRRKFAAPNQSAVRLWIEDQPVLDSFSAHPTLFDSDELTTQGDWPGELMRISGGLFACGAIGDLSPVPPTGSGSPKIEAQRFAAAIQSQQELARWRPVPGDFKWTSVIEDFPAGVPHPNFAADYHTNQALANAVVGRFAPRQGQFFAMNWGNFAIVTIPGEPSIGVARRIDALGRKLGFDRVIVLDHVNGWMGYVLEEQDYLRGGYEATLNLYGPKSCDLVVNGAMDALRKLRQLVNVTR